jgi:hypothetical protein
VENYRFEFVSSSGCLSACQILVFVKSSLIVATYTGEGSSVTNECELIAWVAVNRHKLTANRLLFIEHYPDYLWKNHPETFKLITFTQQKEGFTNPVWTELDNQTTRVLVQLMTD